ncbi:hypothetical protein CYY_003559 [Polysphondylium violaceum]|uniref:Transmembrane protein n=1 Tax=Polysphondylium violaceum TaxID=133409 RepID=A0A8J4PY83_9MYCE|nr:hypothetical protein CYY_003559 [Polysphondylium violaceum]
MLSRVCKYSLTSFGSRSSGLFKSHRVALHNKIVLSSVRFYSTEKSNNNNNNSNDTTTTTANTNTTLSTDSVVAQPTFNVDLSKYKTNETLKDMNPDHLVYKSSWENTLAFIKYFLTGQTVISISAPLIALYNKLEPTTVLFLTGFSVWGVIFQAMGQRMMSFFVGRLYRNPDEKFIRVVQYAGKTNVLKIPTDEIQQSIIGGRTKPYMLLSNGAIFFFEKNGILENPEEFENILCGQEYLDKVKMKEDEEYKRLFDEIGSDQSHLKQTSEDLDRELRDLEKEIEQQDQNKDKKDN